MQNETVNEDVQLMNDPKPKTMPGVSVSYAGNGKSITSNAMGMRAMQSRVWQFRGEQYLLLKSPPASGKSRALMFVALDKLHRQNLKQAIVVVPESRSCKLRQYSAGQRRILLGLDRRATMESL